MTAKDDLLLAVIDGVREHMKEIVRERRLRGEQASLVMSSPESAVLLISEGMISLHRDGHRFSLGSEADAEPPPSDHEALPSVTLEGQVAALLAVLHSAAGVSTEWLTAPADQQSAIARLELAAHNA